MACTTILVGKRASYDGSTMIARNDDDRIYSFYDDIQQEIVHFDSGAEGTKLVSPLSPDLAEFTEEELSILESIYQRFKSENSTKISDISHNEDAWQKYVDSGQMINYDMAFTLKAI